ncbi:hypothetical protein SBA3_1330028 [Candidatus Sulfopaludibacter sp. SbA3]|nr:hypothetical protein SBA3_1330028 [Candidatus Sulfopaludibacter sp. SbA3]
MLMNAFDVKDYQVQGPEWLATERFDISAKVPANITKEQFGLMIQKLLAGRFQMTYHHESREQAVYALVVAKGGSKLKAPDANDAGGGPGAMAVMGGGHLQARKIVAAGIASMLSTFVDRPVIDETGLTGFYQFTLNWAPEGASDASSGPTIYAAIQQELGLRLEPRKMLRKMLLDHVIIDHIEKVPTAN